MHAQGAGRPQFKLGKDKNPVDCTPEVRSVELNPGDNAIVLATDGQWDVLSNVAVVELLLTVRHSPGWVAPDSTVHQLNQKDTGHAQRDTSAGMVKHLLTGRPDQCSASNGLLCTVAYCIQSACC